MTLSDACPINITNDASRSVNNGIMSIIEKSRVMFKITTIMKIVICL
jgi:hypothetical protein